MFSDEDLLQLSALQHFLFCERQCALIHIEQVWAENLYTIEGEILHKRAHSGSREKRPGKRTEFGMPIRSLELGLSGKTDAVEYGADGSVLVVEMRGINIKEGALYYGKTRRRKPVPFDTVLRERTRQTVVRLHEFLQGGKTPPPVYSSATCPRCSLLTYCMPKKLAKPSSIRNYFSRMLKEEAKQ
jgi:CRISPR-associated exonuclease Cas4